MSLTRALRCASVLVAGGIACSTPARTDAYPTGEYAVEACTAAVAYTNNSWTFTTNNPKGIEAHTTCGEPPTAGDPPSLSNLSLGDTLGQQGVAVGSFGQWEFAAPTGTSIREVFGNDILMKAGGNAAWNVFLDSQNDEGDVQLQQTCATTAEEPECTVGGAFQVPGLDARAVKLGIECDAETYEPGKSYTVCASGNEFGHDARAGFNEVTIVLSDQTPPTSVSASQIPAGPQHGTITITGSATDTITGLVSLSIIDSDGTVIGGPVSIGDCNYSLLTPCPTHASELALPIDTEKLPDGENQIRVLATNAAHDQSTSPAYSLTVENDRPTTSHEPQQGSNGHVEAGNSGEQSTATGTSIDETRQTTQRSSSPQASKPNLTVAFAKPRLFRHGLLLSGIVPTNATGLLQLTVRGHLTDHRAWTSTVRLRLPMAHGRFRSLIALPGGLKLRRLTIESAYPGSTLYAPTRTFDAFSLKP